MYVCLPACLAAQLFSPRPYIQVHIHSHTQTPHATQIPLQIALMPPLSHTLNLCNIHIHIVPAAIISGFATVFFPLEQLLIFRGVDAEQLRRREASLSQILREIATRKKQILVVSLAKMSSTIHSPSPMLSTVGGGGGSSSGGIGGTAAGGSSSGGQLSGMGRSRSRDAHENNNSSNNSIVVVNSNSNSNNNINADSILNNNSNSSNNNSNSTSTSTGHVGRQYQSPSSRTLQTLLGTHNHADILS